MIIKENLDVTKYNTLRLKSEARILYIPESMEELNSLVKNLNRANERYLILSGGSNIIMNKRIKEPIIFMRGLNTVIEYCKKDKYIKCGASVTLQQLIIFLKNNNLGGIEYLYSVPGLLGGAVYMNAGRGRQYLESISDYIEYVEYIDNGEVYRIEKSMCKFGYRESVFQGKKWVITNIIFRFPEQESCITEAKIRDRLTHSNNKLDYEYPSCGSVFKFCYFPILRLLKGFKIGGGRYSFKTINWISNTGNATYGQIISLIRISRIIHRVFLKKCKCEVIVWK